MAKPTKIGFFDDVNFTKEFEENTAVNVGRNKTIRVRVTSGDGGTPKTGVIIRHFVKINGVPQVTVLVPNINSDNAGANAAKTASKHNGRYEVLKTIRTAIDG